MAYYRQVYRHLHYLYYKPNLPLPAVYQQPRVWYHWLRPVMEKYRHAGSVVVKLCISNVCLSVPRRCKENCAVSPHALPHPFPPQTVCTVGWKEMMASGTNRTPADHLTTSSFRLPGALVNTYPGPPDSQAPWRPGTSGPSLTPSLLWLSRPFGLWLAKLGKMWWVVSQIWFNTDSNELSQSLVRLTNLGFELSRNWVYQEKWNVEFSQSWVTWLSMSQSRVTPKNMSRAQPSHQEPGNVLKVGGVKQLPTISIWIFFPWNVIELL